MDGTTGIVNVCPNVLQGASNHMFLTLINTLMAAQCGLGPDGHYPPDYGPKLKDGDEFDFIVVGAGSAGAVLANRLSEISEWKILLLEAGGYPSGMSEIPGLLFSLQGTAEDWKYEMEPSKSYCVSQKNNRCRCPRGKGLGGSSLINAMLYTRSTKYDHDRWIDDGNEGWDYDTLVKYYKKLENIHLEDTTGYGTEGELHVTQYTNTHPLRKILQEAYEELGYDKYTEDKPHGFKDMLMSIYKGTRQSSAKAFLSPVKDRKNLYVATGAHVSRLLVKNYNTLTVNGVEVKIGQQIISLKTRNEVIVSAGTIGSPQILMNTGIGPKEHLSKLEIPVLKDLRVGDNFQDHAALPILAIGLDTSAFRSESPLHLIDQLYKFFMHREGALTTVDITNFANFINTKNTTGCANIQYIHAAIRKRDPYLLQEAIRCMGIPEEIAKRIEEYNQNSPILIIAPALLRPKSRGSVRLSNSDPFSHPIIVPNFLSDKNGEDIDTILNAVKIIQKLIQTNTFAPYHPKLIDPSMASCKGMVPQSDEFWKCVIRNALSTMYHPVGSCKMGPAGDPTAVVSPRLNVHGIKGVRVIDGSIIPIATSCNTNAPVMMIAEKGADLIKEDWLQKKKEEL